MERKDINPWLHIWTEPRKTMRSILNTDPYRMIIWLAIIAGILSALTFVFLNWYPASQLSKHPLLISTCIVLGGIIGVVMLYFMGWLFKLTGSWLGGKGNFTEVKSAVGWSNYPNIVAHIFGILRIFSLTHYWLQMVLGILSFAAGIWAFVISLKLIGESHQFSAWKSLLAIIIALILIFVVIMIIALIIPLLKPLFQ